MIPRKALDLIEEFEGFSPVPYHDSVGVPTIGFGSTYYPDGTRVQITDLAISKERGRECLEYHCEKRVLPSLAGLPTLVEGQKAALISFIYNVGEGNFRGSTLRRKLEAGDLLGAADEFPKWRKAGGQVLKGLVRRRAAEKEMFST